MDTSATSAVLLCIPGSFWSSLQNLLFYANYIQPKSPESEDQKKYNESLAYKY